MADPMAEGVNMKLGDSKDLDMFVSDTGERIQTTLKTTATDDDLRAALAKKDKEFKELNTVIFEALNPPDKNKTLIDFMVNLQEEIRKTKERFGDFAGTKTMGMEQIVNTIGDYVKKTTGFQDALTTAQQQLMDFDTKRDAIAKKIDSFREKLIPEKELRVLERLLRQVEKREKELAQEGEDKSLAKSIKDGLESPLTKLRRQFYEADRLVSTGALSQKDFAKFAAKNMLQQRKLMEGSPFLDGGRSGFRDLGKKIQDSIIEKAQEDVEKKQLAELEKLYGATQAVEKAVKDSAKKPATLG